jgi:predicted DNA-binding protein (MmcQ/YjbR family)
VTVKCEPDRAHVLRRAYPSIGPGRYLNKAHWISVGPGRGITTDLVEELVEIPMTSSWIRCRTVGSPWT